MNHFPIIEIADWTREAPRFCDPGRKLLLSIRAYQPCGTVAVGTFLSHET